MGRPLDDYSKKRDFARTPEPAPASDASAAPAAAFVVHRHEARALHYDLRLAMDGALACWAVPKGFSYDPSAKKLAVRTEDHPLEYLTFDGVIPAGEYGAGTMTIWDAGHYEVVHAESGPSAVAAGELKVVMHGRRLRGEWHLVKTRQAENSWLLFKSKDVYAGPARDSALPIDLSAAKPRALPKRPTRMEPGASCAPFDDPAWLFEMAFTGRRVFAEKRGELLRLRGLEAAPAGVLRGLGALAATDALLDGVLVVVDEAGRPSAERLEAWLQDPDDASRTPPVFYAFDLLHFDDFDLRPLPLRDRKAALRAILPEDAALLFVDHVAAEGRQLAAAVAAAGLTAVLAKRADAPYVPGPSDAWRAVAVSATPGDAAAATVDEALRRHAGRGRQRSRVRISNPRKVFWPAEGFTKGDLVEYYDAVAETLLPYLRDRPVHMNRFPDGIEGKSFYQHAANETVPDWIERIYVDEKDEREGKPSILVNDRESLLALVNLGSIDLHPWLSRVGSLDSPDWGILDLDPKGAPFSHVVRIAKVVGRVLRGIGLRPCVKTSGSTGIHVHVPLVPGYSYETSRMFCEGVARVVVRELKDIATVERQVGSREGKVYVDYGQNGRGQTVVSPYVARPVPGAMVSTPLHWDELDGDLDPARFTIATVPARLAEVGDLFEPTLTDPQELLGAIESLQAMVEEGRRS